MVHIEITKEYLKNLGFSAVIVAVVIGLGFSILTEVNQEIKKQESKCDYRCIEKCDLGLVGLNAMSFMCSEASGADVQGWSLRERECFRSCLERTCFNGEVQHYKDKWFKGRECGFLDHFVVWMFFSSLGSFLLGLFLLVKTKSED